MVNQTPQYSWPRIKEQKILDKKKSIALKELNKQKEILSEQIEEQNEFFIKTKNEQQKELEQLDEEINKMKDKIEKSKKDLNPFYDYQVKNTVIRVPKWNYHLCYYKKDKPLDKYTYFDQVHIQIWKNHNNYPRQGRVIHHIDFNKENNDISNLKEVMKEEHEKLHKTRQYKSH